MQGQNSCLVKPWSNGHFLSILALLGFLISFANAAIHYHEFVIERKPVRRLCRTHSIIIVNGRFPGPTLNVRNGDTLVIKAINRARYNVTLHWHGVRQIGTQWADGPAYVTQCPIQNGATYTYRFTIIKQEGTLWWHAHSKFIRATVYGALVIRPKLGSSYPFPKPTHEVPVILGEWWNSDIISVLRQAVFTGGGPNVSDAYTINGQPGDLYPCSSQGTFKVPVKSGDTVLLRVINAALNQQLFFTVANHRLTVVAADATYHKPFGTRVIMLGPGQTTDVLLTANQPPARYYMAARAYATGQGVPFDNTTTTAILEYRTATGGVSSSRPLLPRLPAYNDTNTANAFVNQLRSIPCPEAKVPIQIEHNLFFTVGLSLVNCIPGPRCQGPNNTRFAANMNNISFILPRTTSLLQAYYNNIPRIFTTDFPPVPPVQFNYTGNVPRALWPPRFGTKLYKLAFGSTVQIVLQDTAIFSVEDHPIHLHGYHFFVVGQGFGNFNPQTDPQRFNLVDPPVRNTIDVPPGGWAVIRFVADNPGIWLFHCHIDSHLFWGLAMSFLVEKGIGPLQTVPPPPFDLPRC